MNCQNTVMYLCPRCRKQLRHASTGDFPHWSCADCGGRAVNLTLLRENVRSAPINAMWQAAAEAPASRGRPCPGCEQPMATVQVPPPATGFSVDVCKPCQFFWFDAGEFETFPALPVPTAPPPKAMPSPSAVSVDELQSAARAASEGMQARLAEEGQHERDWWWESLLDIFFPSAYRRPGDRW